jgi:hypothetical protein
MPGERIEQVHHAGDDLDRRLGWLGGHAGGGNGMSFLILYDEIWSDNRGAGGITGRPR